MFQFLDSKGNKVGDAGINTTQLRLRSDAVLLMLVWECDITITKDGHFYDRIYYRKHRVA